MSTAQANVKFSPSAALRVKSLLADEEDKTLNLRVFITGGGCSGFQYGFTFDSDISSDDTIIETDGVKLLIDSMSYQYLAGAEIDYAEDIKGEQFIIRNPNAKTTCGCGSSFST